MKPPTTVLVISMMFLSQTMAADDSDWPCWRGPSCNGTAPPHDGELVEKPSEAKLVWRSEELVYSTYRGTCSGK